MIGGIAVLLPFSCKIVATTDGLWVTGNLVLVLVLMQLQ